MIGAAAADDKEFDILKGLWSPDGKGKAPSEASRQRYVINSSSYASDFPAYGALPAANLVPKKPFAKGWAKFEGTSEAMHTYNADGQDRHFAKQKDEKQRTKDYQRR